MNRKLKRQVERAKTQCRNRRLWHRVVAGLGCAVTFCTTYAMILPAITLEAAEHVLDCPYSVHAHSDGCRDEGNNLICGKADYAVHTHDSGCYDEDGALVCLLPEKEAHTHTETCYVTSAVLTCQQEVHNHEDSCYEMPAEGITEPAGEEGQSEGAAPVLICEKPEHSHGEACYEEQRELVCEKDEIILHAHSEECCEEDVLICGKMEVLEHIHGEGCFADVSEETEETEAASEAATETSAPSTEPAGTEEPAAETTEPVESGAAVSPNGSQSDVVLTADGDATIVASGTCGTNVTWTLTSDDVLTISGTGAMTRSGWSS